MVSRNFPRPLLPASSSPLDASACLADFFGVSFLGAAFAEEDPMVVLSDSLTTSASGFASASLFPVLVIASYFAGVGDGLFSVLNLILTIFGIQDDGKIFLLFMVAFAIMVISARTGASGTQLSKIRASHSLGATNNQILRHVILPNALPEILTGVRIAIGVCWGTLVAAEMLAGTTGIGFIENVARTVSDYELIWVTILIMGLLGLMFDLVMRWAISRLIPWRGKG